MAASPVAPSSGELGSGDDAAVEVEHRAAEELVLGEVDADDLERVAVEVDERGGLAGPGVFALAELDHEPLADELGDEVGDRDAGEAGLAGDVGPALRARGVQGLQHERAVVAASVLGEHLVGGAQGPRAGEDRRAGERHREQVGGTP